MSSIGPPAVPRDGSDRLTAGNLGALGLSDIVQILVLGCKTGCITLKSEHGEGRIWFRDGAAVHATLGEQAGEPAFCALVGWGSGTFLIEHESTCAESTIRSDTMLLVMEGLRRLDEGRLADAEAGSAEPAPTHEAPPPDWRPARTYILGGSVSVIGVIAVVLALATSAPGEPPADPVSGAQGAVTLARAHLPLDGSSPERAPEPVEPEEVREPVEPPKRKALPEAEPEVAISVDVEPEPLPPPVEFGPPPPPTGALDLVVKGKLKGGSLELLLDGEPVFAVDPASAGDRGRLAESGVVEIPRGEYELIARLTDARQRRYEKRALVSLDAGERRTVRLVAGRMLGAPLTLKVLESNPGTPQD